MRYARPVSAEKAWRPAGWPRETSAFLLGADEQTRLRERPDMVNAFGPISSRQRESIHLLAEEVDATLQCLERYFGDAERLLSALHWRVTPHRTVLRGALAVAVGGDYDAVVEFAVSLDFRSGPGGRHWVVEAGIHCDPADPGAEMRTVRSLANRRLYEPLAAMEGLERATHEISRIAIARTAEEWFEEGQL